MPVPPVATTLYHQWVYQTQHFPEADKLVSPISNDWYTQSVIMSHNCYATVAMRPLIEQNIKHPPLRFNDAQQLSNDNKACF